MTWFFCTSAAGAGLTGSKMATRIGSLEEFELKEIGGIHQGVSSKISLYYTNFSGLLGVSWVQGKWGRMFWRFTMHFVQDLLMNPYGS